MHLAGAGVAHHADDLFRGGPAHQRIVDQDDALAFDRHAGMLAVADRGGHAGIRHRHHDVDLDMAFARELRAEGFSHLIHRPSADDGIRPREIDVFEDAGPRRFWRKRLVALRAAVVEHDDLAGVDVADVFRADDVERAGFRGEDRTAVEFAQHQRTYAERIAR